MKNILKPVLMLIILLISCCLSSAGGPPSHIAEIFVGDAVQVYPANSGWAETTAVAFGPGEHSACPDGRLFFGAGTHIVATSLAGTPFPGTPTTPNPWDLKFLEAHDPVIIYDNQMVKLKNGDLLYTVEGVTWNDNVSPHPSWWDKTIEYPMKDQTYTWPGGRGNIYVYRSNDCGATWSHFSDIDAAVLAIPLDRDKNIYVKGVCGVPRLRKSDTGVKTSEAGGWDGHFLYSDPYSGNLFVSTICSYGSGQENVEYAKALIITSHDNGANWSVIGQKSIPLGQSFWRVPVSTIKSGKAAFAFNENTELKMLVFNSDATSLDFLQATTIANIAPGGMPSYIQTDNTGFHGFFSLAGNNQDPPRFYASTYNWVNKELTFNLFNVTPEFGVQTLDQVKPQDTGGMAIHASFIESLPNDSTSVFYWTDIHPTNPNKYSLRYQVLSGGEALLTEPGWLTIRNNNPYTWDYHQHWDSNQNKWVGDFIGDYHTGAAYRDKNGTKKFIAHWSENGSLHFNTISIGPPRGRAWISGWRQEGLGYGDAQLQAQGYGMTDLTATVLSGDQVRYNAVWSKTSQPHTWIGGWTQTDFVNKNDSLHAQGYAPINLSAMVLSGDQVRYNAIWSKTDESHPWIAGWTQTDFVNKNDSLHAQGYAPIDLSAMVLSGGQVRYNAIWSKTDESHPWIAGWTQTDFGNKNDSLHSQGYELINLNAMVLPGYQVRYNAIWAKTDEQHPWIGGWAQQDFTNLNAALISQGFQVKELSTILLAGEQIRYNVLWDPLYSIYLPLVLR
jgi:hypothetical protein